jgi:tetratricopeptide (TPR) repeat protein
MVLEKLKRYSEALEAYGKATTLNPSLDRAWYRQGHVLMLTGSYEASLQSLEKATKLNPKNTEALDDMGLVQAKLNSADTKPNRIENATLPDPSNKDFQENTNMAVEAKGTVPEKTIKFPVG